MSSDITSTVAEALQNSVFGRHGVGGGYAGLLREWAHHAGTEASLTEKGSPTRVEGGGAWCMQAVQPVWALLCFPQVALCLC